MKRTLKFILKALVALVVLALALLAFVLVYNRFDAPLTTEAQAMLAPRPVPGNAGDNAYFVLLGMRAPAGQDAQVVGMALDRLHFDAYGKTPAPAEPPDETAVLGGAGVQLQRLEALRCNWFEKDCMAQFRSQRAAIDKFGADQAFLFERYQRVLALPVFWDRPTESINEPVPSFALFIDMDGLAQARAVYACDQGDCAAALAHVSRVTGTMRRIMANTSSLMTKLVFSQLLSNNLALLNALVRTYPVLAAQQAKALVALALPLSAAEEGLDKVVDAEVGTAARNFMFRDSVEDMTLNADGRGAGTKVIGALMNGVYKRQSTVNFLASRKPFFAVDSRWMRGQKGIADKDVNPHTRWPSGSFWRDYVDNPAGRILVAIATPDLGVYADRMLDIDGYQRLTALHLLIATGNTPDAAIPALVEAQALRYGDPYLGRPMQWDAAARTLVFQGHSRPTSSGPPDGKFTVVVARSAA